MEQSYLDYMRRIERSATLTANCEDNKTMQKCGQLARRLTNNIITYDDLPLANMKYHFQVRNHKFNDNLLATRAQ